MDDNRIIVLLTRKMVGEITLVELEELKNLLAKHPDAVYYDEFVKELWNTQTQDNIDIEGKYREHLSRHKDKLAFEEVSELVDTAVYQTPSRNKRKKFFYMGAAAILFFICVATVFFEGDILESHAAKVEIVAEKGVRKQLSLSDGTKVWLNADSKLSYDDLDKGSTRLVNLEGEAYFDVAKDQRRPFIIQTKKISIKVLGTAFNVRAYPNEAKTEAALIKGAIELSVNGQPSEKILLKPNEKVAVIDGHPAGKKGTRAAKGITLKIGNLSKINIDDKIYIQETSWMENKLIFKDETMEELIPKLERWYNVNIQVKEAKVRNYRYTATITKENISQVLDAMQLVKPFNYKMEKNEITIY